MRVVFDCALPVGCAGGMAARPIKLIIQVIRDLEFIIKSDTSVGKCLPKS